MGLFFSLAILIIIATVFAYINDRFIKLPSTIGIMVITIIFSLGLVFTQTIDPEPLAEVYVLIREIDFTQLLMGGMLYFLLFAGAIQVDFDELKKEKVSIIVLSTLSVIISTFFVGGILYAASNYLFPLIGIHPQIPFIYCLLFGSLISPTDPVAVLSILKKSNVSKTLENKITGEALFNDGVAVILFSLIASIALGTEHVDDITFGSISWLLVKEVFGAFIAGIALGYAALYAIRTTKDEKLPILITLSVVIAGYLVSQSMHISGPLTMVSAGLLISYRGRKSTTPHGESRTFLKVFWELIDEILNAILFLLIGFELLIMPDLGNYWLLGVLAIVTVLLGRYVSIKLPMTIIPFKEKFSKRSIFILVWGGLRGGVSIALALSLASSEFRDSIVAGTYYVVLFSIIVQGLTIEKLSKKIKD